MSKSSEAAEPTGELIEPYIAPGLEMVVKLMEEFIPFNRFLGMKTHRVEHGLAILKIPWRDDLVGDASRPALHGGVTSALADTAGGCACFASIPAGEAASTVDLRIDYLRPGRAGDLYAEARLIRLGNRVAVVRMHVYTGGVPALGSPARDQAIATGQGVYNIHRRKR